MKTFCSLSTIIIALLSAMPAAGADDVPCLFSEAGLPDSGNEPLIVALQENGGAAQPGAVEFICEGRRLVGIEVALPAGATREIGLLARSGSGRSLEPHLKLEHDWVASSRPTGGEESPGRLRLKFSAAAGIEPRSVRVASVALGRLEEPARKAPAQIALSLTVRDETPLFRDGFREFEVDPVIGQFSMNL